MRPARPTARGGVSQPGSALQIQDHLSAGTAAVAAGTKPIRYPSPRRCRRATIVPSAAADKRSAGDHNISTPAALPLTQTQHHAEAKTRGGSKASRQARDHRDRWRHGPSVMTTQHHDASQQHETAALQVHRGAADARAPTRQSPPERPSSLLAPRRSSTTCQPPTTRSTTTFQPPADRPAAMTLQLARAPAARPSKNPLPA